VLAIVERREQSGLSAGEQQSATVRIFANYSSECVIRNPVCDFLPGLAVVAGLVQIWFEVIELVHRRRYISSARIDRRSVDRIDLNPFGHAFRSYVLPVLASVARDVNESIVRSNPNRSFLNR